MNRLKRILLPFLFLICCSSVSHAGSGFVFLKDTSKLFFVSNNEIYSPDKKQLLYFHKGNIFFTGEADEKQNIFLLTTSSNPSSSGLEMMYEKENREPDFSFTNNKFYPGKIESEDLRESTELLHIEKSKKWMAFYSSYNDSLLAYYIADSLPSSTAILVAYTLIKKYKLEKKTEAQHHQLPFQTNTFSTIKPAWGNTTANEWIWDGKVFRPRWNTDQRFMWTFDGQTVKPLYGNNIYEQYSWDGENFKPVWRTNHAEEWSWDGKMLKPVWDTDWANQYKMENGVIQPWSNVHPEKEWHFDGDIPLPLIILVVSGIAKSN